jgi:hypothetical protein
MTISNKIYQFAGPIFATKLIDINNRINFKNSMYTLLKQFIQFNDIIGVKYVFLLDYNMDHPNFNILMNKAIVTNRIDIAKLFDYKSRNLSGGDPNIYNNGLNFGMTFATCNDNNELVKYFINQEQINPKYPCFTYIDLNNGIDWASRVNDMEMVLYFINRGASYERALHVATHHHNTEILEYLTNKFENEKHMRKIESTDYCIKKREDSWNT